MNNRDDIIRLALEAGATDYGCSIVIGHDELLRVIAEAVATERAARIKAQIELRDMREDMTQRAMQAEKDAYRRGVRDEREACAREVERECIGFAHDDVQLNRIATTIRARGEKGGV